MKDIGIIIVNWNTRELLHRCLQSVVASEGDFSAEVVVVDNGSTDGSADMVEQDFPQFRLISGHGNVGYPRGNNIGIRSIGITDNPGEPGAQVTGDAPRYVLLLNPDTELPPRALVDMLAYLDANPGIGVAGPKLVLPDGSLDLACRRSLPTVEVSFWRMVGLSKLFPKHHRFGQYNLTYLDEDEITDVGSLVGAFMMLRTDAVARVGLMDEQFFMYGEDIDWCKRIGEDGWRVVYYPRVEVLHVKRAASSQNSRAKFEFVRAFLLFYRKHYRKQTPRLMHVAVLCGIALWGGPKIWSEVFMPARQAPAV